MNIKNEVNLIDKPVKDQLLAVGEILESISSENSIEIITNEELLIKYIPPKAIEKKIKIKLKLKNENWHIHLEKE